MIEPAAVELPPQRDLVDGSWATPEQTAEAWVEDPNTGEARQPQAVTGPDGIEAALAAAARLHRSGDWSGTGPAERADALDAMAAELEPLAPRVAELEAATTGATVATTSALAFIVGASFRLAAEQLRGGLLERRFDGPTGRAVEVELVGRGPAVLLVPWNAPAPMAAHKAASALAAGCPVIIKPPERAPHGTAVLAEAATAAGMPDGLVQLVHGGPPVGAALIRDERTRAVSFTGGVEGGRAIAEVCGRRLVPVQLELGGHSPLLVMPDADLGAVVEAVVGLLSTLNGQWCRALGRLLVPAGREAEVVDAVAEALAGLPLGHSLDPAAAMGPIVHSSHLVHLQHRVEELVAAGGTAVAPTPLPTDGALAGGSWMSPTLLTGVDPSLTVTEVFGPVASVHPYTDLDEAVALANGTPYGLEAYVVGADEEAAMAVARRIVAGGVKVNGVSPISLHLMAPRPAWGISGLVDEGTTETIEFFGGHRVVGVEGSLGAS